MDIRGKTCLITGATSGIGKETALKLAEKGIKIIIAGRDARKCATTCLEIIKKTGNSSIEYYTFDLSSFTSISNFIGKLTAKHHSIDFLINNAGIWEKKRKLSADGIEMTIAVNHFGPLLLTLLLKDFLSRSVAPAVINLSSSSYKQGKINSDDLEMRENYNGFKAYANSKLISLLVMQYLSGEYAKSKIRINNVHPGVVFTGIYKDFNPVLREIFKLTMISASKGADAVVSLALSNSFDITGQYFDRFVGSYIMIDEESKKLSERFWLKSLDYFALHKEKIDMHLLFNAGH